jgi:hypothetical protein
VALVHRALSTATGAMMFGLFSLPFAFAFGLSYPIREVVELPLSVLESTAEPITDADIVPHVNAYSMRGLGNIWQSFPLDENGNIAEQHRREAQILAELRAEELGLPVKSSGNRMPSYLSDADLDALAMLIEMSEEADARAPVEYPPQLPPATMAVTPSYKPASLTPIEAATRFLAWIRSTGATGTYANEQLASLYKRHCETEILKPVHQNQLRKHLVRMTGVEKIQSDRRGTDGTRIKHWVIADSAADLLTTEWKQAA